MATKRVCDRCGAEINPYNSVTYAGMRRVKNNIKSCQNLEASIKNAAKVYVANNKYQLGFSCNASETTSIVKIPIQDLIDSGDLKLQNDNLVNPKNNSTIKQDKEITVKYDCNKKIFTYDFTLNCD